jgi:O-glycosyl hydrolase
MPSTRLRPRTIPRCLRALTAGLLILGLGALVAPGQRQAQPAAAQTTAGTLRVDGSRQFQRIDGFGVNVNPKAEPNADFAGAISQLADQLGASIWRVIVENSDWESVNDDADPFYFNWDYYGAVYESPKFQAIWNTIAQLNQKGAPQIVLAAMGLLPDWMGTGEIRPSLEDEWVEMIVSMAYYGRNMRGLRFNLLSPLNESDLGVPEGPKVSPAQYGRLMHKLVARLQAVGLGDLRLIGPESGDIGTGVRSYLPSLLADDTVMAQVDHFALHNYIGETGGTDGAIKASAYPNRTFWMTEFAAVGGDLDNGHPVTNEWSFASDSADFLIRLLNGGASAALTYEGFDSYYEHHRSFSYWGLLAYDASSGSYAPRKRFFTTAQLMKFIPPGSVRVATDVSRGDIHAVAVTHPDTGAVTVAGYNLSSGPIALTVTLSGLPEVSRLAHYQTTRAADLVRVGDVAVSGGSITITVPAEGFFTLTTVGG